MTSKKLTHDEIQQALEELSGWSIVEGKLHKAFKFDSFSEAIGWMVSIAIYVDKIEHHPEWMNVYNRVQVDLVTHDLDDAISNLDVELARKMNTIAGQG